MKVLHINMKYKIILNVNKIYKFEIWLFTLKFFER